jgi:O-antigen/teichoic acid export membrane protein
MLQFKKVALINLSANLITLIVTIYLAWKGWGVWALVAQQLLLGLLCTILYWVVSKWRPKLCFSKSSFKQLFNFGVFVLFSNLFNTFCNNIQGLLIGKIYNSSTLGYYTKAQRTEGYASTFISSILDQVSYPVLSEAQNDKQRMISIIKKFITTSAYLSFPLLALMILLARPIFIFLYSEKWIDSVPYFQILCLAGGSVCLQSINYYAVAAIGESKDLFKWTVIKRTIGLLFIIAGLYFYGLWGLLWGIVCSSWVIYFINALLVSQHIGYRILPQIKDLLSPAILSCISFAISYFIGSYLNDNMFVKAIVQLAVFLFCFFVCSVFFKAEAYINTTEIFKYLLSNLLKRNDLYRKN